MLRVHCFGISFTPKLIPTLFLFLGLTLSISLGIWQIHRGIEKRVIEHDFQSNASTTLQKTHEQPLKTLQYRNIQLNGRYDNAHTLLLDNKIQNHRVGYEVLTPFIPNDSPRIILINRGWIPRTNQRQHIPTIPPITGQQTIKGRIKILTKSRFVLDNSINSKTWPMRIQAIDFKRIASVYNKPLYPFIVLLSPNASGGFIRNWKPISISPSKHFAYATQWFALALTLVIIYLCLSIKRGSHEH